MSTCNDIVRRALRALGVVAAGKAPAGSDAESGMEYLQSLVLDLPGLLKNGRWCEIAVSGAYTAREGDRCMVTSPGVVTLPASVSCGQGARPPQDLARVQILGAGATNAGLWIYSATKAAWSQVDALEITDDSPFGSEDDEGLAFMLAVNMAGEYGGEGELGQRTVAIAQQAARSFRSRFKRAQPIDWSRPEPLSPLSACDEGPYLDGCNY